MEHTNKDLTPEERIAMGECVSPLTVERCPYCVDTCEAHHWKVHIMETLLNNRVNKPEDDNLEN